MTRNNLPDHLLTARDAEPVAIIGRGAIGSWLAERLSVPHRFVGRGEPLPMAGLVVEAAGHQALADYGEAALAQGSDLLVASVGALADPELLGRLTDHPGKGQLLLPAGALTGIDGLAAARAGGLTKVTYTARKPPATLADDLDADRETVLFEGNAREAALAFPRSTNVAATVALAGLGFEETVVRVIADPAVDMNIHVVEAEGAFGEFSLRISGRPLPGNPKTSSLTAMSLLRAVNNRTSAIVI